MSASHKLLSSSSSPQSCQCAVVSLPKGSVKSGARPKVEGFEVIEVCPSHCLTIQARERAVSKEQRWRERLICFHGQQGRQGKARGATYTEGPSLPGTYMSQGKGSVLFLSGEVPLQMYM